MSSSSEVTQILNAMERGEPQAAAQLLPVVYGELRRLAAFKMASEPPGQTLQPTALVHEAWLRISSDQNQKWNGRAHFFAAAAEAMRRILVDIARRKRTIRHGGGQERVDLEELELAATAKDDELLAVHEVLERLAAQDAQRAELVKLRYFVGLTLEETAQVMNISVPTARRYWAYAQAWLHREIGQHGKH